VNCPNCNEEVESLVPVDAGLKLRMQADGGLENIPIQICQNCIGKFSVTLSQGAILRKELQAKEQNRMMLWRSRVNLVKQAKTFMNQKNFSDAAVTYEKYLRVLEIVYEKKSGELVPDLFNNEARRSEMTVITSVYWDLMRIYDSSPKHLDRLEKSADKLAAFARFTPIYSSIIRRAEAEVRSAKNPKAFKRFLSKSQSLRARCFIATSAFEYESPTVLTLCDFRDQILLKNFFGRKFVDFYYLVSPSIAAKLDRYSVFKPLIRLILLTFSSFLKYLLPNPPQN
jgi:hypothetical protein